MATNFVQRMIIEHSELVERIKQLNDYVYSKKSDKDWSGRSSENKVFVFSKEDYKLNKGDYVLVQAKECTQGTILGSIVNSPLTTGQA